MIVMVTGGRNYNDMSRMRDALKDYDNVGTYLLQGGATGADYLASRIWHKEFQNPYITHPAPWDR